MAGQNHDHVVHARTDNDSMMSSQAWALYCKRQLATERIRILKRLHRRGINDLFEQDVFVIIIYHQVHWVLAWVRPSQELVTISIVDSLNCDKSTHFTAIK